MQHLTRRFLSPFVRLFLIICWLLQSGCATNHFARSYRDFSRNLAQRVPYAGDPRIFLSNDLQADAEDFSRQPYLLIGISSFSTSGKVTEEMLREQAKRVGAEVVICKSDYLGPEQGMKTIPVYTPGQTTTTVSSGNVNANVNADVHGAGGSVYGSAYASASYQGNSTTSSSGIWSTSVVPYIRHHHGYTALFWCRSKQPVFGVKTVPLPQEMRKQLQQNSGAYVELVMEGGPAFRADILEGDVIIAIADTPVIARDDLDGILTKYAGSQVNVTVLREGEEKVLPVQLNPEM